MPSGRKARKPSSARSPRPTTTRTTIFLWTRTSAGFRRLTKTSRPSRVCFGKNKFREYADGKQLRWTTAKFSLSAAERGEQRYLISWFKVGIFEDVIHQDDEFAHDGSEGDFGGLTRQAEALIKLFKLVVRMSGDECSHVEYPSDRSASATDAAASMPVTTFTRMRSQTGQCGSLAAVERAQFGQFGQYAQSGDGAHTSNGFELLHPFIQPRRVRAQFLELDFNLRQIPFQTADQALSLTPQGWQGEPLGLESLGDEDFEHLYPTADQFGQLLFLWGTWCGRLGKQCLTVGRQDGGVNGIGLGALAGGAGEVPDTGGVQDADRNLGFMQCRDNVAFVTAGGFTDDLDSGLGGQKFQQPPVAGGGVGQVVEATGQVKLQVKLGNIQAGVDSGHSVLAHSCKCERALVGRSINGSSLGHRHERLRLPAHLAKSQCQRTTNSSAPLPSGLQAGRRSHLPIRSVPDKDRWKGRYKRARERGFLRSASSPRPSPSSATEEREINRRCSLASRIFSTKQLPVCATKAKRAVLFRPPAG